MGWNTCEWTVTARLDNHNDERTTRDDKLAEELTRELRTLLSQDKYRPIDLTLCGGRGWPDEVES